MSNHEFGTRNPGECRIAKPRSQEWELRGRLSLHRQHAALYRQEAREAKANENMSRLRRALRNLRESEAAIARLTAEQSP